MLPLLLTRLLAAGERKAYKHAFLFLGLILGWGGMAWGQPGLHTPVDLALGEVSLAVALEAIETQTNLRFVYSPDQVPVAKRVQAEARQETVANLLRRFLEGEPLVVEAMGPQVVIRQADARKAAAPSPRPLKRAWLQGRVLGQPQDRPLAGATVRLPALQRGAFTDSDGSFVLEHLPPGSHQLVVQYLGYRPDTLILELSSGERYSLELALSPAGMSLQTVLITAQVEGQIKALSQQQAGINLREVSVAELHGRYPDLNVAEALQRLPGIQVGRSRGEGASVYLRGLPSDFSTVHINGEQILGTQGDGDRIELLDLIPVDQLGSIVVHKTLTSDMDGDAIAGAIDLQALQAKGLTPSLVAELGGGYNHLSRGWNGIGKLSYQQRALPSSRVPQGRLGWVVSASYFGTDNGRDRLEAAWQERTADEFEDSLSVANAWGNEPGWTLEEYTLRDLENQRTRLGGLASLDFVLSPAHRWEVMALYSRRQDDDLRRRLRSFPGRGDWVQPDFARDAQMRRDLNERDHFTENLSLQARGTHHWQPWEFSYGFHLSEGFRDYHSQRTVFRTRGLDLQTRRAPGALPQVWSPELDIHLPESMEELVDVAQDRELNHSRHLSLRTDGERPVTWGKWQGSWQSGLKYRRVFSSRERDNRMYNFDGPGSPAFAELMAPDEDHRFLQGQLRLGPGLSPARVNAYLADHLADTAWFRFDAQTSARDSEGDYWLTQENIAAAYTQVVLKQARWALQLGVRYSHTWNQSHNNRLDFDEEGEWQGSRPLSAAQTFGLWLPNVQLRWQRDARRQLRLALTRSFARPNLREASPYVVIDREEKTVWMGNPALQPTRAWNLDLGYHQRLGQAGAGLINLYGKALRDVHYRSEGTAPVAPGLPELSGLAGYRFVSWVNGAQLYLIGAEVHLHTYFERLPGRWKGLGVMVNYAFTHRMSLDAAGEPSPLAGQAGHTGNLGLLYAYDRLSVRLALHHDGRFLLERGLVPAQDRIRLARWQWDFSASWAISPRFNLFIELLNLSDAPQTNIYRREAVPQQLETYGWWGRFGLGFRL